jgi:hypothetical protein
MKTRVFASVVVFTAFVLTGAVCAQTGSLTAGLSFPMGDFGDDTGTGAGFAKMGFTVNAEFGYPIGSTEGLLWVLSASLLYNGVDMEDMTIDGVQLDVDAGAWMNVPFLTGIRYEAEVTPTMKVFGTGKLGMSIVRAPKIEISGTYCDAYGCVTISGEEEYDMATAFTFAIGGGIIINEKFHIGFNYISLGEPELEGDVSISVCDDSGYCESESYTVEGYEQPISMFTLFAGIGF